MTKTKKLRRFGSQTYGVTMTGGMLELLGSSLEEAESEAGTEVEMSFYGSTLIIRKAGTPKPSPAELAYFITEDLDYASYFPASPVVPPEDKLTRRFNINALFRPGKFVKMTKTMRSAVRALAELGPLTSDDFTEQTKVHARQATRVLRSGYEEGLFIKNGEIYSLNPDVFEVS